MEIKYWVIVGVALVLGGIVRWSAKLFVNKLLNRIDDIIQSINLLSNKISIHTEKLSVNDDKFFDLYKRLDKIEDEVKDIQIDIAKKYGNK